MLVISLVAIAEEIASAGVRGQTGNIRNGAGLFDRANLVQLSASAKAFCFLAFHGTGDEAVADYVRSGTLPDDSGPDVMVLFTLDEPAPVIVPITSGSLRAWAEVQLGIHPAYRMVRSLFVDKPAPALPGLVVFGDITTDTAGVYVPLSDLDSEQEVRRRLREVFLEVEHTTAKAKPGKLLDDFEGRLRKRGLAFETTERRPVREWLSEGLRFTKEHYGDIVTTLGLIQ